MYQARAKLIKAVEKEGGKKGQDVEGMAAMGCKWANVNMIEPQVRCISLPYLSFTPLTLSQILALCLG